MPLLPPAYPWYTLGIVYPCVQFMATSPRTWSHSLIELYSIDNKKLWGLNSQSTDHQPAIITSTLKRQLSGRHRKAFNILQSCLAKSSWIQLIGKTWLMPDILLRTDWYVELVNRDDSFFRPTDHWWLVRVVLLNELGFWFCQGQVIW